MKIPKELTERLIASERTVFFTGAGISAESGIPVFRGKDGIWNKLKPEELADFNAFLKNPQMVWEWYNHRKQIVNESQPNPAHNAIAELQNYLNDVVVITQNIDNLHRRAGTENIFELHGNIQRNYCIKCHTYYNGDLEFNGSVPVCKCGGFIRPDIVWFGEFLPEVQFSGSEKASNDCDVFFVVGTSAVVYPAASLIYTAKQSGAYIVEINLESTEISSIADESLFGKAGEILPAILNSVKEKLPR